MGRFLRNLLADEQGQDIAEYAVMLALIVVVCLTAITLGSRAAWRRNCTTTSKLSYGSSHWGQRQQRVFQCCQFYSAVIGRPSLA